MRYVLIPSHTGRPIRMADTRQAGRLHRPSGAAQTTMAAESPRMQYPAASIPTPVTNHAQALRR